MTRKKAFTLIELLVVIAIIAILAAILFPVFAQAKAAAKKSATLSNLKQNGTAVAIYLSDADDTYPQSAYCYSGQTAPQSPVGCQIYSIYDALMPYTKNKDIIQDVAEPKAIDWPARLAVVGALPYLNGATTLATATNYINYAGVVPNFAIFEDPGLGQASDNTVNGTSLELPADTIVFATGKQAPAGTINQDVPVAAVGGLQERIRVKYRTITSPFASQVFPGVARHSGTMILSFGDGHAKVFRGTAAFPNLLALDDPTRCPAESPAASNLQERVYNLPFDVNGIPGNIAEPCL